MRIIKEERWIKHRTRVIDNDDVYCRIVMSDNSIIWRSISFDSEDEDETGGLEKKYQQLIKKSNKNTSDTITYTEKHIEYAFKAGRLYSRNYHYDDLLNDHNFQVAKWSHVNIKK